MKTGRWRRTFRESRSVRTSILDENGQMAENVQREQISEDLVDLVTGGLGVARNQAKQKKKKRDDILLPEI